MQSERSWHWKRLSDFNLDRAIWNQIRDLNCESGVENATLVFYISGMSPLGEDGGGGEEVGWEIGRENAAEGANPIQ